MQKPLECTWHAFSPYFDGRISVKECAHPKDGMILFTKSAQKVIQKAFQVHKKRRKKKQPFDNNSSEKLISIRVVAGPKEEFLVYVNEQGIGYRAYWYDNGADYFKDELARIEHNGKVGFLNKFGKVVIEPQYTFVSSFRNGYARACQECQFGKIGEHKTVDSKKWLFIDKRNQIVASPPPVLKLPFYPSAQKSLLEEPTSNSPESRDKLRLKCHQEENPIVCTNYAAFLFEEHFAFNLGYYKFDYSQMEHSSSLSPDEKSKGPQQVLKILKELASRHEAVFSYVGLAEYMLGEFNSSLQTLKKSCEKANRNACYLLTRLKEHRQLTEATSGRAK